MRMREGAGVLTRCHQTGEVRHVHVQVGADHVGDLAHAGKVDLSRNGRAAGDDQLGLVFFCQRLDLIIVQHVVFFADAILHRIEPLARLVGARAVGQVTACVQAHAQNGVAGLDQCLEHALVGLRARVRLHVGKAAAKQLFGAVDGQVLGDVHVLAAAIVTPSGIAFGVFVGHHRALCFHHGGRDDVFGCDQLDLVALTTQLGCDRAEQLGITVRQGLGEKSVRTVRCVQFVIS
ncbi:hypothetical protein RUM4293_02615 [Ruegeria atlantica]|uniref:Uncharacterized protein n=1 Tax=Ruegeria atlantica TaxID=81569 RepID=A0A0P1E4W9_9RHOB|nr:hypothetical protein RUM4293_02615 [Ruegeria atlantica]